MVGLSMFFTAVMVQRILVVMRLTAAQRTVVCMQGFALLFPVTHHSQENCYSVPLCCHHAKVNFRCLIYIGSINSKRCTVTVQGFHVMLLFFQLFPDSH